MLYTVRWTDASLKEMGRLPKEIAKRIFDKVESVANDPFRFVKKLVGFDLYRLKVGDYRVIMAIEKGKLVILILEVGHRKTVYNKY